MEVNWKHYIKKLGINILFTYELIQHIFSNSQVNRHSKAKTMTDSTAHETMYIQ